MHKKLRHNCQPNTIRTISSTILLFSEFFKLRGHVHLSEIGREQVSVLVEHEQDRGMAPISVDGRLKALYAFLNYLVEHDVMAAEVIKCKLRIKVPDALPRAIDPDDINFLWP
jgi:integrase/recombinase XerD